MNTMSTPSAEGVLGEVAVIGGGAAGMMAAGAAQEAGASVTLYEGTDRLGKKLGITGKGRCNVTNNCTVEEFLENVTRNPRFLYGALSALSPQDTMAFFEERGVRLKTERGRRVFPEDDRARSIVDAMRGYVRGVALRHAKVRRLDRSEDGLTVVTDGGASSYRAVILATGGRSYPLTGSDGSGYRLATRLGHRMTPLIPSLIPIESPSPLCPAMQGLSLKNVSIRILDAEGRTLYRDFGEMMFTHFGVTGPMILSASAHLREVDIATLTLSLDLKPALDEAVLDRRLLSDFQAAPNRDLINAMGALLPAKMIPSFLQVSGLSPHRKVNTLTRTERHGLLSLLKDFRLPLSALRPIEEAIVTSGGIEVREVSPKTMGSRLIPGLYFAGEMLDVDAYTGGYNLQIAFATGRLAGLSAAAYCATL